MRIGMLAQRVGLKTSAIRYYEEIGLLPAAQRADNGQRDYGANDLDRLLFIRRCRDFGFPIETVRALVSLRSDTSRPCSHARDLATGHLTEVRHKLVELRQLESSLLSFVATCDEACSGGSGADCPVLKGLPALPA